MFDKRNKLSDQVAADVRAHMGDKVYKTVIPRNVRISEAPSHGLPALVYDLRCPGSQAYIKLAGETDPARARTCCRSRTHEVGTNAHRGLGRGLSALIGDEAVPTARRGARRGARIVPVAFLRPNRFQPRKTFSRGRAQRSRQLDQGEGRAAADPGAAGQG